MQKEIIFNNEIIEINKQRNYHKQYAIDTYDLTYKRKCNGIKINGSRCLREQRSIIKNFFRVLSCQNLQNEIIKKYSQCNNLMLYFCHQHQSMSFLKYINNSQLILYAKNFIEKKRHREFLVNKTNLCTDVINIILSYIY